MHDKLQKDRRPVKDLAVIEMGKAALQMVFKIHGRKEFLQDYQPGERGEGLGFEF